MEVIIRRHRYAQLDADVTWVSSSLCWTRRGSLRKRMNRSECRLGHGLGWTQGIMFYAEAWIPPREGALWGHAWEFGAVHILYNGLEVEVQWLRLTGEVNNL